MPFVVKISRPNPFPSLSVAEKMIDVKDHSRHGWPCRRFGPWPNSSAAHSRTLFGSTVFKRICHADITSTTAFLVRGQIVLAVQS